MQVSSNVSSIACSNYAVLRWSEGPQAQPREELVEVIKDQVSQTIVRSSLRLNRETVVTLVGKNYTEEGVVQCCQSEDTWFLLTLVGKLPNRDAGFLPDPGVFAVDGFLTEDQEAAILREVDEQAVPSLEPHNRIASRSARQFV